MGNGDSQYRRAAARFSGRLTSMVGGMVVALSTAAAVWFVVFFFLGPLHGADEAITRFSFALKCTCMAVLLCFLTGIEAVSHERLMSDAFDPLAGRESERLRINLRYLQNTLEQLILFVTGLFGLAAYARDGEQMLAVVAATMVWIFSRAAFWIGYQFGPQYRVFGLTGMLQSMLVLFYVAGRFGYEIAGYVGAASPIVVFLAIEAFLVATTRRHTPGARE